MTPEAEGTERGGLAQEVVARPPRQARSLETMGRLLDAAEELLETETFDSLRVQDVARQAGVTTGALYARFKNKAGLLRALEERLHSTFGRGLRETLADKAWATEPLQPLLAKILSRMLGGYRARRGLVRAVALASRKDPAVAERMDRFNGEAFIRPLTAVLVRRSDIEHLNPEQAVRFALFALANAVGAFAVFPETDPLALKMPDEAFVRSLSEMVARYLTPGS